jgi:hypothetical protein
MHRALYSNNIQNAKKTVSCRFSIGELFLLWNLSRKNFKLWNNRYKSNIELHNNYKKILHLGSFLVPIVWLQPSSIRLQKRSIVLNRVPATFGLSRHGHRGIVFVRNLFWITYLLYLTWYHLCHQCFHELNISSRPQLIHHIFVKYNNHVFFLYLCEKIACIFKFKWITGTQD